MSKTTETPERAKIRHARTRHVDTAIAHLREAVCELRTAEFAAEGPGHRYAAEILDVLNGMALDSEEASARRAAHARAASPIGHKPGTTAPSADPERI